MRHRSSRSKGWPKSRSQKPPRFFGTEKHHRAVLGGDEGGAYAECDHRHRTVAQAFRCAQKSGGYVVPVDWMFDSQIGDYATVVSSFTPNERRQLDQLKQRRRRG